MIGGPDYIQQLTHEVTAGIVQFSQELRKHKSASFTFNVEERDGAITLTSVQSTLDTDPLVVVCIMHEICRACVAHEMSEIAPPTLADA